MLILGEKDVRRCLDMKECIEVNKTALASIRTDASPEKGVVPTRLALPYDSGTDNAQDWTLFKPAACYAPSHTIMGMKLVSVRSQNPEIGKPMVPATIVMLDAASGETKAVLGGTYLTAARTAAGSALATELCCTNGKRLVVFGAGLQAECHVDALFHVQPSIQHVTIINRGTERAEALAAKLQTDYPNLAVEIILLSNAEAKKQAVSQADILVACTNTSTPLWDGSWLKPGCHVNGIGSYTPDMQEVDLHTVRRSKILVDTPEALQVGDLKDVVNEHRYKLLGDVLYNDNSWSDSATNDDALDCTFYKAVGTAIQDVLTAQVVMARAKELGLGNEVDMS